MLKVGICDDEPLIIEALRRIILDIADKNGWKISISCFESGRALLEVVDVLEVVFLDIDMPKLDGIETGKMIRERKLDCKIIMSTGRTDMFKDAFRIQAFRFVTKPFDKIEIEEALQAVFCTQIGTEIIELYEKRNSYQILQRDILYVIAYDGYSIFVASGKDKNRILRKDCSLAELEQELPKELFFRVNRQYIVNLGEIKEYKGGNILIQDKKIVISRRKKKEFEQAYMEYDLNVRK